MIGVIGCLLPVAYAAWTDFKDYRVPNVITLPVLIAGLIYAIYDGQVTGALIGACVLFLIGLIPFLMGGMGGGDVKLMAALGAWFGPHDGLAILLIACVVGVAWGVGKKLNSGTFVMWASDLLRSLFLRLVLHVKGAVDLPRLPAGDNAAAPQEAVPFGTCLAFSAWAVYIGGAGLGLV